MLKEKLFLIVVTATIACSNILSAQNNTNSPYSLFGLGLENKTATGNLTALGNTGIANDNKYQINTFNPASLGNIQKKSFLYEFGLNGSISTLKSSSLTETTNNANVSHIAIAFPIKHNWGIGIGLLPKTKVGYDITVQNDLEGSSSGTYASIIRGDGGLNKFYISTGAKLGKTVSVGLETSFLFGSINQTTLVLSESLFTIEDTNNYAGVNLRTGFQYNFLDSRKTSIGGVLEFPLYLGGSLTRSSFRTTTSGNIDFVEFEAESDIDDFDLPIVSGIGVTSNIYQDFTASFDFKKLLWEETDQANTTDQYKNQNIYAFGLEFAPSKKKLKYLNKLKYRFGFNYNTGALNISDKRINSYFASLGVGIPLGKNGLNLMNLSYSYGKEGNTDNKLIQENFHKVTLNLSFIGNWFKERKIF